MTLFVVATPIGNLGDMTFRAVETLKKVDLIACEDTRQTKKLLDTYEIGTPMTSFHSHTGTLKIERILEELEAGKSIALVSDAGTPGISDPAFALTSEARKRGIQIVPIPGAAAFLTALSGSGVPIDKFLYLGFLPIKKGRQTIFAEMAAEKRTIVFYESTHRIARTLSNLSTVLGVDRPVIIARELTKMFEEFKTGTLADIAQEYAKKPPKGEFVVILPAKERGEGKGESKK